MNTTCNLRRSAALATLALISTLHFHSSDARAQGSLTPPPGAPAPVMKSLDQIEARTPINTLPGDATALHIITLPGSYYLTGPINGNSGKCGIRIEAAHVSLDLNGFMMEAAGGATTGIEINLSGGQVSIRNGQLRFWPKGGILCPQAVNCAIEDIAISSVNGPGISIAGPSTVRRVRVEGAVTAGINVKSGLISDCTVKNVTALQAGSPTSGILAEGGTVLSSTVATITGNGFLTRGIAAGVVRDCSVENVQTTGGHASGIMATVIDNTGNSLWTGSAENCRVRNVSSTGLASGLYYFGTIRGCTVNGVTASTVTGLAMGICGLNACQSQVSDVKAAGSFALGISANNVLECMVQIVKNTGNGNATGIVLDEGTGNSRGGAARNCTVRGAEDYGIYAFDGAVVSGCSVTGLSTPYVGVSKGFYAYGKGNLFEGNSATHCDTGFDVNSGNLCKGNVAANNSTDYWSSMVVVTSQGAATNAFSNFSVP
jgi:hypothetical protein